MAMFIGYSALSLHEINISTEWRWRTPLPVDLAMPRDRRSCSPATPASPLQPSLRVFRGLIPGFGGPQHRHPGACEAIHQVEVHLLHGFPGRPPDQFPGFRGLPLPPLRIAGEFQDLDREIRRIVCRARRNTRTRR